MGKYHSNTLFRVNPATLPIRIISGYIRILYCLSDHGNSLFNVPEQGGIQERNDVWFVVYVTGGITVCTGSLFSGISAISARTLFARGGISHSAISFQSLCNHCRSYRECG